jgi:hypothetical protein
VIAWKATLLIFFLVTGIPADVQLKQRSDLEDRTASAARTLHKIYVLTPNQTLRIVYTNSWMGMSAWNMTSTMLGSKVLSGMPSSRRIRCSIAGVDLTNVAEKELKDESGDESGDSTTF